MVVHKCGGPETSSDHHYLPCLLTFRSSTADDKNNKVIIVSRQSRGSGIVFVPLQRIPALNCSNCCFCAWRSCGWSTTCRRHNQRLLKEERWRAAMLMVAGHQQGEWLLTGIGSPSSCSCRCGAGLVSGSRCGSGWSSCRRNPTCVKGGAQLHFILELLVFH